MIKAPLSMSIFELILVEGKSWSILLEIRPFNGSDLTFKAYAMLKECSGNFNLKFFHDDF